MSENIKTTLIYFGNLENSKYGTLRSFIAILLVVLSLFGLMNLSDNFKDIVKKRKLGVLIGIIALVSAMCVIVPRDDFDAIKYGLSIGAVISIFIFISYYENLIWKHLLYFSISTLSIGIITYIVYILSKKLDWYPYSPC
jgi:hypothetical protein